MLSFSLRAVLRNESCIFCAGLFSICRSPCQFGLSKRCSPQPVARRSQRPGGIRPASIRLFHSTHRQPNPLGNIPYHTASGQTFQPVGRESSAKVLTFLGSILETWVTW